jgi:cytochrome c553
MRTAVVYLCAGLAASACAGSKPGERASAPDESKPSPTPDSSAREMIIRTRMQGHERLGEAMRDAMARGDLDEVKGDAKLLGELRIDTSNSELWRRMLDATKAAAARIVVASDLKEVSRGIGAVAKTCGDCHTLMGRPGKIVGYERAQGPSVPAGMQHHQWAAAQLWDGLVVPSDEAWNWGALALSEAQLTPEQLTPGKSPAQGVVDMTQTVRALGHKAADVERVDVRADLYGDLLATCAACHQWLGGGPDAESSGNR